MCICGIQATARKACLVALEVVEDDINCTTLLTVVLQQHINTQSADSSMNTNSDGDGGASDDLAGVAVLVDLAESGPLAELLVVIHLEELDAVLRAKGLNELDVVLLVAVAGKHHKVCLAPKMPSAMSKHSDGF